MLNRPSGSKTNSCASVIQLMRIFRIIKKNPEQCFIISEFVPDCASKRQIVKSALNTLIKLDLVDKVELNYHETNAHQKSGCWGYRYKV